MRNILISISCCLLALLPLKACSQSLLPEKEGDKMHYNASIEMEKGYVSGICIMTLQKEEIRGSLFNEFGISAMDFSFDTKENSVKLYSVISMLDKWYIKKVLKNDLLLLFKNLKDGKTQYIDDKYNITYTFNPMKPEKEEEGDNKEDNNDITE